MYMRFYFTKQKSADCNLKRTTQIEDGGWGFTCRKIPGLRSVFHLKWICEKETDLAGSSCVCQWCSCGEIWWEKNQELWNKTKTTGPGFRRDAGG